MLVERIDAYTASTRAVPSRILFYRDGLSTSQYAQVQDEELCQIKAACQTCKCSTAKITIVVAIKRHTTRFYPAKKEDTHKNGNCKADTLVDCAITSPHYSDFYLQSHHRLKGTTIPTHYMVIANKIGFRDREIQDLTFKLCYTYARATMGVSYAPPAYYADRLCDRDCAYLRDWFSPDRESVHFETYLRTRDAIEQRYAPRLTQMKQALPANPIPAGRNTARKLPAEIVMERGHARFVEGKIEEDFLAEAKTEWKGLRSDGPGPWGKELDGTMF